MMRRGGGLARATSFASSTATNRPFWRSAIARSSRIGWPVESTATKASWNCLVSCSGAVVQAATRNIGSQGRSGDSPAKHLNQVFDFFRGARSETQPFAPDRLGQISYVDESGGGKATFIGKARSCGAGAGGVLSRILLPSENAASAKFVRRAPLGRNVGVETGPDAWRSRRRAWSSKRLSAPSCSSRPSLALDTAAFRTPMRLVVDLHRHRKGMPVLAAVGEREARGIGEAAGRAMHHLGHQRQGLRRCARRRPGSAAGRRSRPAPARPPPPARRAAGA